MSIILGIAIIVAVTIAYVYSLTNDFWDSFKSVLWLGLGLASIIFAIGLITSGVEAL